MFIFICEKTHFVKSVQSGPYFPAFGLDTERYFASVFRPNAGKYGPEKTLYLNTFTL